MKNLAVRFRIWIKKSRIKKCQQFRIKNWIKRDHRTKKTMINRSLKEQLMPFLQMILIEKALKNIFLNYLMIKSIELSNNNSSSRFSSLKRNFFRCYTLTKNSFAEYIFFRSWNLTRIKKKMIYNDNLKTIRVFFSNILKSRQNFDTSISHNVD